MASATEMKDATSDVVNATSGIKDLVRQKYGEAARRVGTGTKGGCCGTSTS